MTIIADMPLLQARTARDNCVQEILDLCAADANSDLVVELEYICRCESNWQQRLVKVRTQIQRIHNQGRSLEVFSELQASVMRCNQLELQAVKK